MEKATENPPIGLTEAARRENERFEARLNAFIREVREVSLSILVWGPNPQSSSPVAKKRIEIRDELMKLGHNARFSEDIRAQTDELSLSEKAREFAQARAAHLIVILVEDAPGALAEAHDFGNDPEIAHKVCVMFPQKYRQGYSAQGAMKDLSDGYGGVYWYEEEDLEICKVRTRAVEWAEARRNIYNYRRRGSHE